MRQIWVYQLSCKQIIIIHLQKITIEILNAIKHKMTSKNTKRRYWIIWYVVAVCNLVSRLNPCFYAKSQYLYVNFSVFPFKWYYFYSYPILWFITLEILPAHTSNNEITFYKIIVWPKFTYEVIKIWYQFISHPASFQ